MWVVSDYSIAVSVLKDTARFLPVSDYTPMLKKLQVCDAALEVMNQCIPLHTARISTSFGVAHSRIRNAVKSYFSVRAINSYELIIQKVLESHLAQIKSKAQIDLVHDFTSHISLNVLLTLLGVPQADFAYIRELHDKITALFTQVLVYDQQMQSAHAFLALKSYFFKLLDEQSTLPDASLLSHLLQNLHSGSLDISKAELVQVLIDIVSAGFDTTWMAMNWALYYSLVAENMPSDMSNKSYERFTLEALRLNMAQMGLVRMAVEDVTLSGSSIKKGTMLYVLHTYANRDENIFPQPHCFSMQRINLNKQLTFGAGIHHCLGAHLAKKEIEMVLKAVWSTYPKICLDASEFAVKQYGSIRKITRMVVYLEGV